MPCPSGLLYSLTDANDLLRQRLEAVDLCATLYHGVFRQLHSLCRRYQRLPTTCRLPKEAIRTEQDFLKDITCYTDLYEGMYGTQRVTLKLLRIHHHNPEETKEVGLASWLDRDTALLLIGANTGILQ